MFQSLFRRFIDTLRCPAPEEAQAPSAPSKLSSPRKLAKKVRQTVKKLFGRKSHSAGDNAISKPASTEEEKTEPILTGPQDEDGDDREEVAEARPEEAVDARVEDTTAAREAEDMRKLLLILEARREELAAELQALQACLLVKSRIPPRPPKDHRQAVLRQLQVSIAAHHAMHGRARFSAIRQAFEANGFQLAGR